jgi:hypothetical protein
MSDEKKQNERKYTQQELSENVASAERDLMRGFPSVEFLYNSKSGGPLSSFTPSVTLKVTGDAKFIKDFSKKLSKFVEEAVNDLSIPEYKE